MQCARHRGASARSLLHGCTYTRLRDPRRGSLPGAVAQCVRAQGNRCRKKGATSEGMAGESVAGICHTESSDLDDQQCHRYRWSRQSRMASFRAGQAEPCPRRLGTSEFGSTTTAAGCTDLRPSLHSAVPIPAKFWATPAIGHGAPFSGPPSSGAAIEISPEILERSRPNAGELGHICGEFGQPLVVRRRPS